MTNGLDPFHRCSFLLKGYNYSQPGVYFVTIVTFHRNCIFGEVVDGQMQLNKYGQIVVESWEWLSKHYPYVVVDPFMVMPNHFHGILHIVELDDDCRGGSRATKTGGTVPAPTKIKNLGQLIGVFKTMSAKNSNQIRHKKGSPVWQRNYYEHIIRNELELNDIARYIFTNPETWVHDQEYMQ